MNVLFTQFSQNYLSYRKVISLTTARLLTFFKIQTNQKVFEENSLLNILKVKSTERFRVYIHVHALNAVERTLTC